MRRRVDPDRLRGVLDDLGLRYRLSGSSYVFTCPLCRKPDKLWMYRDSGGFKCWVCAETRGFSGAPEYALVEMTGQDVRRIRERLYGTSLAVGSRKLPINFGEGNWEDDPDAEITEPEMEPTEWPDLLFHSVDSPDGADGAAYLESRGVPAAVAAEYGVAYYPARRSLVFPARLGGKTYGWQYRIIDPDFVELPDGTTVSRPKAINESLPRDKIVLFADRLKGSRHAVVTEGPFDALKAHLCGGNVATMGKAVADAQVALLLRSGVGLVYSALDPDALPEVDRLLRRLGDAVEFHHVDVPRPYKDLGAMRMEDVPDVVFSTPILLPGRRLPIYFPERRVG